MTDLVVLNRLPRYARNDVTMTVEKKQKRMTGIEPALACWRHAESGSEGLCATTTLHPHKLARVTGIEPVP